MLLRNRIIVAVVAVYLLFGVVAQAVQRGMILPQFERLEREEATKNVARCREAILQEVDHLEVLCRDWADWGETYQFIDDGNPEYVASTLHFGSFKAAELNLIYLFRLNGQVRWGKCFDLAAERELPLPDLPARLKGAREDYTSHGSTDSVKSGILLTPQGPMMLVSLPILTGNSQGPVRGALVMGRILDAQRIDDISDQTKVPFSVIPLGVGELSAAGRAALERSGGTDRIDVTELDVDQAVGFIHFQDIDGRPVLQLEARLGRDISKRGRQSLQFASFSLMIAAVAVLGLLFFLIQRIVIRPIAALTNHAIEIGASGNVSKKMCLEPRDEVGILAREFDRMVDRLSDSYRRLMDLSRQAGMAQVASSVLHNVGNVMASISCTTETLRSMLQNSRLHRLRQVEDLIAPHADDLPQFLVEDPRGRQVLPYICQLAARWREEYLALTAKLDSLFANIAHVNAVVDAQQVHATRTRVIEPTQVDRLIRDAVILCEPNYQRHQIKLTQTIDESLPAVHVDRVPILQVLVNLLTNAMESVCAAEREEKSVRITASAIGGQAVRIEVADNGLGIAAADMPRLFQQGFTTKSDGHGFGLHFSALAVQELGGLISASSDGVGRGATFVVVLPTTDPHSVNPPPTSEEPAEATTYA